MLHVHSILEATKLRSICLIGFEVNYLIDALISLLLEGAIDCNIIINTLFGISRKGFNIPNGQFHREWSTTKVVIAIAKSAIHDVIWLMV